MSRHRRGLVVIAVAAILLALPGCLVEQTTMGPEGRLAVLDNVPGLLSRGLPGDWVIEGDRQAVLDRLSTVTRDGLSGLRVESGEAAFAVVRRTRSLLLAAPYFNWSWYMEPHAGKTHPVQVVVGFHGGDPTGRSRGGDPFAWLGTELPPHDRLLVFDWADTALRRGTLSRPRGDEEFRAAHYTVRGGRENAGRWHRETVDLLGLYRRLWPGDDAGETRVVFVGLAAAPGERPVAGLFSGLVLSR